MPFESAMYPGEKIIDDDTSDEELGLGEEKAGMPRGRTGPSEYEGRGGVVPFPSELLIDPSEYEPRIKEMEEKRTRFSDQVSQMKVPSSNQDQLLYCWIFSPVHVVECLYAIQNQVYVPLSAASTGAVITGFRNHGGYGREAVEAISEIGVVPQSMWPNAVLNKKYLTEDAKREALNYRISKWITTSTFAQVFSMLLRRNPGSGGYNWWGHQVSLFDPVWKNGKPGIRIRNQWYPDGVKPWGDDNYAILQGNRMVPDDAVWPLLVSAS